jgi:hypothetical protein
VEEEAEEIEEDEEDEAEEVRLEVEEIVGDEAEAEAEVERRLKCSREKNHIFLTPHNRRHALIRSHTVPPAESLHPTKSWQRPKTPFYPARELTLAR